MTEVFITCGAFLVGFALAWYLKGFEARKNEAVLKERLRACEEKQKFYQELPELLSQNFRVLAQEALEKSTSQFLKLAEGLFESREKSLSSLTRPLEEQLNLLSQEIKRLEVRRETAFKELEERLKALVQEHLPRLEEETKALKRLFEIPQSRGQWGEIQLKRLVELAGLTEHVDFSTQAPISQGRRPDLLVHLPGERLIAVDAKAPLPKEEEGYARLLKRHIEGLSQKAYWEGIKDLAGRGPEFVVLFLPAEGLLARAYQEDPQILEYASSKKVILATPLTLLAMLKTVALSWREEAFVQGAEEIIRAGEDLYRRLDTFSRHLTALGKALARCVEQFNHTVGSFKKRLLPAAKRFEELKVGGGGLKTPAELQRPAGQKELDL